MPGSAVARALEPLTEEALAVLEATASSKAVVDAVRRYRTKLRPSRLAVSGRDLEKIGYQPGPEMGMALLRLREAMYDGGAGTKKQQLDLARKLLKM
ncbi:MAG: hypothetical protein M5R36_01545 [Deltaproteobacteria bacterium]|nr:hypothetical protein [Deltaproteobacteria bacterium]